MIQIQENYQTLQSRAIRTNNSKSIGLTSRFGEYKKRAYRDYLHYPIGISSLFSLMEAPLESNLMDELEADS